MRILVVGGGGREHALAWSLARSAGADVHVAPGNPGCEELATRHDVAAGDTAGIVALCRSLRADLVVIGPDDPLAAGLGDDLRSVGVAVFGPDREAARIEWSKAFAKDVMGAAGVPTPTATLCAGRDEALRAIGALAGRVVVKLDGLALGKGVIVCSDTTEATSAVDALGGTDPLLVEERIEGPELSLLAICDGTRALLLPPARDYKRIGDGDTGPNTGGMGAFSPAGGFAEAELSALVEQIHLPVLAELGRRGAPFRGCLYAGVMLTAAGPRVLEFNARLGDPETQVILPRLDCDLAELLSAAAQGDLSDASIAVRDEAAVTVVLASRGYPATSTPRCPIDGIAAARALVAPTGGEVFQAGTRRDAGRLVTDGGRVLAVTALGAGVEEARRLAYEASAAITFEGRQQRTDVAAASRHGGSAR